MSTNDTDVGLEGVIVAKTRLSDVDGERGKLVIAGWDVERLGETGTFEDVVHLLEHGSLPDERGRRDVVRALGEARVEAFEWLRASWAGIDAKEGMDALRAGVARLASEDPHRVIAAVPVIASAWWHLRTGEAPIVPDRSLSHAADYLRMVGGKPARSPLVAALDAYLVTVVDHWMNASTFAARVVASTGSDLVSSVVAAIGALKGPLHGGAPGPVLDMLDAIGAKENALAWLEGEIAAKRRIMGMGHRVYRVRDPRAAVLERAIAQLEAEVGRSGRLGLARAVEHAAESVLAARHPTRPLRANVEFYTAVLLDAIGLPRELFTPTFAVGRVAGWCAHVAEQRATGRLIRPSSTYVGPAPATA